MKYDEFIFCFVAYAEIIEILYILFTTAYIYYCPVMLYETIKEGVIFAHKKTHGD